jgi:hypothetical protein
MLLHLVHKNISSDHPWNTKSSKIFHLVISIDTLDMNRVGTAAGWSIVYSGKYTVDVFSTEMAHIVFALDFKK